MGFPIASKASSLFLASLGGLGQLQWRLRVTLDLQQPVPLGMDRGSLVGIFARFTAS